MNGSSLTFCCPQNCVVSSECFQKSLGSALLLLLLFLIKFTGFWPTGSLAICPWKKAIVLCFYGCQARPGNWWEDLRVVGIDNGDIMTSLAMHCYRSLCAQKWYLQATLGSWRHSGTCTELYSIAPIPQHPQNHLVTCWCHFQVHRVMSASQESGDGFLHFPPFLPCWPVNWWWASTHWGQEIPAPSREWQAYSFIHRDTIQVLGEKEKGTLYVLRRLYLYYFISDFSKKRSMTEEGSG